MNRAETDPDRPVRIWHQSMATLGEFGAYQDLLEQHIKALAPPGVTVDLHGATASSYGGEPPVKVLKYAYLRQLIQRQAMAACRQAEAEGYDAVALATFGEPYLRESRSLVDIPVASMVEACLLTASSLAGRFALVCLGPGAVPRVHDLVAGHGLSGRVSGVYSLEPPASERVIVELMSADDITEFTAGLEPVAEQARAAGAELLIPAEGAFNELLWSRGVRELAGLPVLDALGVTLSFTRYLVDLQRRGRTTVSRASTYAKPPAELLGRIEQALS